MITNIQKWFLIMALWVFMIFSVFAFYWLLIRPARVRVMCAEKAKKISLETKSGLLNTLEINRAVYSDCLRCSGIEK